MSKFTCEQAKEQALIHSWTAGYIYLQDISNPYWEHSNTIPEVECCYSIKSDVLIFPVFEVSGKPEIVYPKRKKNFVEIVNIIEDTENRTEN